MFAGNCVNLILCSLRHFMLLLQVYGEQIGGVQPSGKYNVRVIGYYGVGGVGKTTMCKVLCNALALEFEEKVCHVEMAPNPSPSQKLMHLQEVLKKLTYTSEEVLCGLKEGEVRTSHVMHATSKSFFVMISESW